MNLFRHKPVIPFNKVFCRSVLVSINIQNVTDNDGNITCIMSIWREEHVFLYVLMSFVCIMCRLLRNPAPMVVSVPKTPHKSFVN